MGGCHQTCGLWTRCAALSSTLQHYFTIILALSAATKSLVSPPLATARVAGQRWMCFPQFTSPLWLQRWTADGACRRCALWLWLSQRILLIICRYMERLD
jgi:hypothetical protein